MSFSLRVQVDHPDGYSSTFPIVESHTYNLAPMWCRALKIDSTRDLDGLDCKWLQVRAREGLLDILSSQKEYEAMEPDNGWGDFDGFFEIYMRFVRAVYAHPTGRIRWSG